MLPELAIVLGLLHLGSDSSHRPELSLPSPSFGVSAGVSLRVVKAAFFACTCFERAYKNF